MLCIIVYMSKLKSEMLISKVIEILTIFRRKYTYSGGMVQIRGIHQT